MAAGVYSVFVDSVEYPFISVHYKRGYQLDVKQFEVVLVYTQDLTVNHGSLVEVKRDGVVVHSGRARNIIKGENNRVTVQCRDRLSGADKKKVPTRVYSTLTALGTHVTDQLGGLTDLSVGTVQAGDVVGMEYGADDESVYERNRALQEIVFVSGYEVYISPSGVVDFKGQCGVDRSASVVFRKGEELKEWVDSHTVSSEHVVERVSVLGAGQLDMMVYGSAGSSDPSVATKTVNRKSLTSFTACSLAAAALYSDLSQSTISWGRISVVNTHEGLAFDYMDTVRVVDEGRGVDVNGRVMEVEVWFDCEGLERTEITYCTLTHMFNSEYTVNEGEGVINDLGGRSREFSKTDQRIGDSSSSQGIVGHYRFNEGAGLLAYDASQYRRSGRIYGASWMQGHVGKVLLFDGVNDYVDCGGGLTFGGINQFSFATWFSITGVKSDGNYLCYKSGQFRVSVYTANNAVRFSLFIGGQWRDCITEDGVVAVNERYFIVCRYDGAYLSVTLNNVPVKQVAQAGTIDASGGTVFLGALSASAGFLAGYMYECLLFDRVLAGVECKDLYFNPLTATATPEVVAAIQKSLAYLTSGKKITLKSPLDGEGALATASVAGGAVTGVTVLNGGNEYTDGVCIQFTGGGGSGATAEATVVDGHITQIDVTAGGSGYSSAPTVNVGGDYVDVDTLMVADTDYPWIKNPILRVSQGFWGKKDIFSNGFIGCNSPVGATGGGAILLGNRLTDMDDPPRITLTNSGSGYDTLYLTKVNLPSVVTRSNITSGMLAHLVCGVVTATTINAPVVTDDSFTASGAVTQYYIASIVGDNTVGLANRANATGQIGVFQESKGNGETVLVRKSGRSSVVAGETLTAGDRVTCDNVGRAIKYSSHKHDFAMTNESTHTHSAGSIIADSATPNTSSESSHIHAAGSIIADSVTPNTSSESSHIHAAGSIIADSATPNTSADGVHSHSEGEHTHGAGSNLYASDASNAGLHSHTVAHPHTGSVTINSATPETSSGGSHYHSVGGTTGYIYSGNPYEDHTHSSGGVGVETTTTDGSHTHTVAHPHTGSVTIDSATPNTSSNGVHNHVCGGYTGGLYTGGSTGNSSTHTHTVAHPHTCSGNSGVGSAHSHTVAHPHICSGNSGAGSSHSHTVAHPHTCSGNSGAGSAHKHTCGHTESEVFVGDGFTGAVATGDFLGKVLIGAGVGNLAEVEIMLGA